MAETTYADSVGASRVAALLNREIVLALADWTDLRNTITFTPFSASGSDTLQTPVITGSYGMTAPGEATAITNTTLLQTSFSLAVARYSLFIEPTDMLQLTNPDGALDVPAIAQIVAMNAGVQFSDMLCALFPSVTAIVGATGTALTVDTVLAAAAALRAANSTGPFTAVLAHKQFTEFQESLRAEVGPLQWVSPSAEMIEAKGPGYQGDWQMISFYSVDSVGDDATDYSGCMFGPEGFRYTEGPVGKMMSQIDRNIAVADSSIFVTVVFDDVLGTFRVIGNYYPAVSIAQQGGAVEILSVLA